MYRIYKIDEVIENTGYAEIDGQTPRQLVCGGKGHLTEDTVSSYGRYPRFIYKLNLDLGDWYIPLSPQSYSALTTLRFASWSVKGDSRCRPDWRELVASASPLALTADSTIADFICEVGRLKAYEKLAEYDQLIRAWTQSWGQPSEPLSDFCEAADLYAAGRRREARGKAQAGLAFSRFYRDGGRLLEERLRETKASKADAA